jgi:hypothetical protein
MNTQRLRELIQYDIHKIPDFINTKVELHKFRYDLICNILFNLELCIDDKILDCCDTYLYDDLIKEMIDLLNESCDLDKGMMFHIWSYIINCYEYYLGLAVANDLFESAANLQKIKTLYNGE